MSKLFGQRLKQVRTEAGLYQSDLSEELKVARNTISDWENAVSEPSIEQMIKLADLLNTTLDYLMGRDR